MRILVTGATGFLGRHVVRGLLRQGHRVRGMGRNLPACRALAAEGADVVNADLRDAAAVAVACEGVDGVVHAGALSAPWGAASEFHATNVGGTANVVAGCRTHGARRLVYVSSPSVVFDGRDQHDLTERAPYAQRFLCVYSLTKKLGEDLVRRAAAEGLETVILRPKALFGPGDTTLLPRLVAAARQGRLPQVGNGRNHIDPTYVANAADAVLLSLNRPQAVGRTYTITNGERVRLWEFIKAVLSRLGVNARLRPVPYPVAYAFAAGLELRARLLGGEPALTRYTAAILGRTQTYDISAARSELGYGPAVSIGEGVERTLAAWGTRDALA